MTDALTQLFSDIVKNWGAYLAALVALSGLSMSLIQVAKELLFLRLHYHHIQIVRWLCNVSRRQARTLIARKTTCSLEGELLRLTSAGNAAALYDAELENVCAQLSAATQMLVDYPSQSPRLLKAIARGASELDLDMIIAADDHVADLDADHRQRLFDARNRVRALTLRSVESFRLLTAVEWRRGLQLASFVLSVAIAGAALVMSGDLRTRPMTVVWSALIAGFLAPVARDLLAAVQQLRRS